MYQSQNRGRKMLSQRSLESKRKLDQNGKKDDIIKNTKSSQQNNTLLNKEGKTSQRYANRKNSIEDTALPLTQDNSRLTEELPVQENYPHRRESEEYRQISSSNSDGSFITRYAIPTRNWEQWKSYQTINEMMPCSYMQSVNEGVPSDEEKNIIAMPVRLDGTRETLICGKNNGNDSTTIGGIQQRSFIIQKENYITSNKINIPQDIIEKEVVRIETLKRRPSSGIRTQTDILEKLKSLSFVQVVTFLSILTLACACWAWFVFSNPLNVGVPKKVSLLRYFMGVLFSAVYDIYQ